MADADTPTPNGEQLQSTDPSIEKPTAEAPITAEPSAAEPTAAEQPADEPQVASTVTVPATPAAPPAVASAAAGTTPSSDEGGEWDLLVSKVQSWLASGQLQQQWQAARTPISLLAGLIAVVQFTLTKMVRSSDRRQVIDGVRQRWQSFRGHS